MFVPAIDLVHSVIVNPLPYSWQIYQHIQIHGQQTCNVSRHCNVSVVAEVQIKSVIFRKMSARTSMIQTVIKVLPINCSIATLTVENMTNGEIK